MKKSKRFLSLAIAVLMFFSCAPTVAFADEADMDFTDATGDESAAGWAWDFETNTLTLSGAEILTNIVLPEEDSTIVITEGTENSVTVTSGNAISSDCSLTIIGGNNAKLTINGENEASNGISARHLEIKDLNIDIDCGNCAIFYNGVTGSASVILNNVSGSIIGKKDCGIQLYIGNNSDNSTDDKDTAFVKIIGCKNLAIKGELYSTSYSSFGHRSAILVRTNDAETNAYVEIAASEVSLEGSNSGILVTNGSSGNASAVWVKISDNSVVDLETITSVWSAIFANNSATGEDATAEIAIEDSTVSAFCPNDVAIMTSASESDSAVNIKNSNVTMSGISAGIRVIASSGDTAKAGIVGSEITVIGEMGKIVDKKYGGTSHDVTEEVLDESTVNIVNVAEIKGKGYRTIQAAVAAAVDGDTIVLTENVELENDFITIANEAKKITLDLNGHTITGTFTTEKKAFVSVTGCELTIKDSSEEKTGGIHAVNTNGNLQNLIRVETSAKMVIESGNFTQDASVNGAGMIDSRGNELITINGGNFRLYNIGTGSNGSPWILNVSGQNDGHILVNGGTFNTDIVNDYWKYEIRLSGTKILENNGNGIWTAVDSAAYNNEPLWVTGEKDVIYIGYTTLKETVKAAIDNIEDAENSGLISTVTLTKDNDEDIEINGRLKFELAGKKYTGEITLTQIDTVLEAPKGLKVVSYDNNFVVIYNAESSKYFLGTHDEKTHTTRAIIEPKDATCIENGCTGDIYCDTCSGYLKFNEVIPVTDHKDDNKDHACDYGCGKVYGEHADANKDHLCDVYGDECANGKIGEHSDADKDHLCDFYGDECAKGKFGEHADKDDDGNHECDYGCGKTLTNHDYGRWVKVYEPTETEPGVKVKTCHECGKKVYADVAPLSEDGIEELGPGMEKPETETESNPNTGAPVFAPAVILVSAAAAFFKKR